MGLGVGWHHQLDGHEFEEGLGDGEGQSMGLQRVRHDLVTEQEDLSPSPLACDLIWK